MNATVTISRRHLLSGRDTEPNPPHPLMEEGLVLVVSCPCVSVLEQQKLIVNI